MVAVDSDFPVVVADSDFPAAVVDSGVVLGFVDSPDTTDKPKGQLNNQDKVTKIKDYSQRKTCLQS